MKALLRWLDQWGRNIAQQRQIQILEEELAEVCDENVRLAVENAELKGRRGPNPSYEPTNGHKVHIMGGGAMCNDCDWLYMPGCGHNADANAHRAALNHERETAGGAS